MPVWLVVKDDASRRFTKEPIIYFSPANKKIFFYQPHGFKNGDFIRILIDTTKRQLRFIRALNSTLTDTYKFTEFDKKKGTIDCPILFREFSETFHIPNKYQSVVITSNVDISDYTLEIFLLNPL